MISLPVIHFFVSVKELHERLADPFPLMGFCVSIMPFPQLIPSVPLTGIRIRTQSRLLCVCYIRTISFKIIFLVDFYCAPRDAAGRMQTTDVCTEVISWLLHSLYSKK